MNLAHRMNLRSRERRRARIEIIPMIDVVFFLLVFFMMASLSMTVYRGLPVNLPRAATGTTPPAETAAITVARDGQAYLDREPVTRPALGERLRRLVGANPSVAILITADEAVAHGRVVDVLDEVRSAGVTRMAIAIRPEAPAR
jgi:biopolymer transport protein ExbD